MGGAKAIPIIAFKEVMGFAGLNLSTCATTGSGDLPVGHFCVESPLQKYFASPVGQIISTNSRHPTPPEGRWPSSRTRGGMRWTRQRLARDGIAGQVERLVSGHRHADERCCSVRQNRVVLTPRRWRQVRGVASAQPGLDKTYPLMTVAKEPGHRGERDISRKTIACGNAGRFRGTRCYSCAFYQYKVHTRPRVQRASGVPHALFGRKIDQRLGRIAPRGRECAFAVIASAAIAVGTLIAERPPHRTVRAAFPHTAPTSGVDGELAVCAPAPVTRLAGTEPGPCCAGSHSPRSPPLAPPTPQRIAPRCSPASQLLRRGLTSHARASSATAPHLPDAGLGDDVSIGRT